MYIYRQSFKWLDPAIDPANFLFHNYIGSETLHPEQPNTTIFCYLATKPEVEGFRDQGFVLPEVESLRVQSL